MAAAAYFDTVQKIFIAFYQRPADPAGLKYWADRIDAANGDAAAVVSAFATSPEAVTLYGTIDKTTIGAVIDKIYLALFNTTPDAAGKKFYVDGFTAGTFTAGTIALNILNGATNDDAVAIANKLQVSNTFTQQVDGRALTSPYFGTGTSFSATYKGDADAQAARDILKTVTASPSTVLSPSQVTVEIQTKIADAGDPIVSQTSGQTFTLTTGVDNLVGTAADETFDASVSVLAGQVLNTLGNADKVDGGAGTDTLFIQNINLAAGNIVAPTSVKGIEVVQLDLSNSAGAYTLNLQSGDNAVTTVKSGNNNAAAASVTNVQGAVKNVELSNTNQNFTLSVAAAALTGTADALALDLNAVTAGTVTVGAATGTNGYETINVSSSGSVANVLTGLAQTATNTTLATINVTGATNLNLGAALNNSVTKVDANAFTGNLTVTGGVSAINVIGGKGNDAINLEGTYTTADTINGGDGTDTLRLNAAEAAVTVAQANVTNVEALRIANTANAQAINTTHFAGVNTVVFDHTGAAGTALTTGNESVVFNAVATGANTVTFNNGDVAAAFGITVNGVAINDVLNVNLRDSDAAGLITTTGAETVNLFSSTGLLAEAADAGVNQLAGFTMTGTAVQETLKISGDVAVTFTAAVTADVVDGSGLTAALTLNAAGVTPVAGGAAITGGSAGDVLIASANGDIISGNAGADNITGLAGADVISGGAGSDTFIYSAINQGGNTAAIGATALTAGDIITDFVSGAGGDRIDVQAGTTTAVAASGLAGAWNLGAAGVYILTGSNLDFVAGTTTTANVAAVIGNVTGAAGNIGYIAILDTQSTASTADDQWNIFEVTTVNARANAALAGTDTITLVGTVNGTALLATDFIA